jgi:hypothetical protein
MKLLSNNIYTHIIQKILLAVTIIFLYLPAITLEKEVMIAMV